MSLSRTEHLLQKLIEESSEIQKDVCKGMLFGLEDKEPGQDLTNQSKIENEVADLLGVVELLIDKGVLRRGQIFNETKISAKKRKVLQWMGYSIEKGLTDG